MVTTPLPSEQESTGTWLLKKRHEDLSVTFRTVWDIYIKFYTVFLTFSIAAMGWLLARPKDQLAMPKHFIHVLGVVFIAQSLLTGATSAFVAFYSRRVARDHASVERELLPSMRQDSFLARSIAIPVGLALWSGLANAVAMLAMSYAWVYVAFYT